MVGELSFKMRKITTSSKTLLLESAMDGNNIGNKSGLSFIIGRYNFNHFQPNSVLKY